MNCTGNTARKGKSRMEQPLILVTNDDGIQSDGLWAAVEAVVPIGEVIVVAPDRQWSAAGRSMPHTVTGNYTETVRHIAGHDVRAYAVDASPAMAADHGVLEFAPRRPDLAISGINFGANVSVDITISGTIGAALEISGFGIPSLAISQEMDPAVYLTGESGTNYDIARAYIRRFAKQVLLQGMPSGADVLNINIPSDATVDTTWRQTHLSRHRYFTPLPPDRTTDIRRPGIELIPDPHQTEPGSDLFALLVNRQVSVTPLSLDMTAPTGDCLSSFMAGR